jgi:hypothetical protein
VILIGPYLGLWEGRIFKYLQLSSFKELATQSVCSLRLALLFRPNSTSKAIESLVTSTTAAVER